MAQQRFSARAEQEIKNFYADVKKDNFFEDETEARDWYLSNCSGCICSLYDCPIKTAKEFYGIVNETSVKQAFELIPYRYECGESANLLACSEEYLYLSANCDYLKKNELNPIEYAALCQDLGFNLETLIDYFNFAFIEYNIPLERINKIWETAKKLPKGFVCKKYCNIHTNFDTNEAESHEI